MAQSKNYKRLYTVINAFGIFTIGIIQNLPGQAIKDLKNLLHTSAANVSFGFSVSSFISAFGALLLGWSYNFFNRQYLFILQFVVLGLSSLVIPFLETLYQYLVVQALFGFVFGGLTSLQNVLVLEMWERDSNPYMQATHFCWSLGSTVAPLISAPFLSKEPHSDNNTDSISTNTTLGSNVNETVQQNMQIWIPFTVGGGAALLAATFIMLIECIKPYKQPPRAIARKLENADKEKKPAVSPRMHWVFIGLLSVILGLFLNVEIMVFYFLPLFLQSSPLSISSQQSSYMAALFSGAHTVIRGLSILISTRIRPSKMLYTCLLTVGLSNLLMYLYYNSSEKMLLLPVALLGFALGPVYPAFHSFVENHIDETNMVSAVILVISMTPSVISPIILGETMKTLPLLLIYMNAVAIVLALLLFMVAHWMANKYYSPIKASEHE